MIVIVSINRNNSGVPGRFFTFAFPYPLNQQSHIYIFTINFVFTLSMAHQTHFPTTRKTALLFETTFIKSITHVKMNRMKYICSSGSPNRTSRTNWGTWSNFRRTTSKILNVTANYRYFLNYITSPFCQRQKCSTNSAITLRWGSQIRLNLLVPSETKPYMRIVLSREGMNQSHSS